MAKCKLYEREGCLERQVTVCMEELCKERREGGREESEVKMHISS